MVMHELLGRRSITTSRPHRSAVRWRLGQVKSRSGVLDEREIGVYNLRIGAIVVVDAH